MRVSPISFVAGGKRDVRLQTYVLHTAAGYLWAARAVSAEDDTWDDSERRFLVQDSVASSLQDMLYLRVLHL